MLLLLQALYMCTDLRTISSLDVSLLADIVPFDVLQYFEFGLKLACMQPQFV